MIATWRWPKASLSVSSMSCGVMPRREAVARSITSDDCCPLSCWSLLRSTSCGSARRRCATCGPHASSSRTSSPWSVYWYCAFPIRPPERTSCAAWKKAGAPGTTATRPRSLVITWSALTLRSASGFSMTNIRAVLVAVLGPLPCTRESHHVRDRRVTPDDVHDLGQLGLHRLERDVLRRLNRPLQPARILLRKESLRDHPEQVAVHGDGQDGHGKDAAGMTQHPRETRLVAAPHPLEGPLARPIEAAVLAVRLPRQEGGAHHRGRGERYQQRDPDRPREGSRGLPAEAGHEAA